METDHSYCGETENFIFTVAAEEVIAGTSDAEVPVKDIKRPFSLPFLQNFVGKDADEVAEAVDVIIKSEPLSNVKEEGPEVVVLDVIDVDDSEASDEEKDELPDNSMIIEKEIHVETCSTKSTFTKNQGLKSNYKTCTKCDMTFSKIQELKSHKKAFHGRRRTPRERKQNLSSDPIQCPVCGNVFKRKGALTAHMEIHVETKSFSCSICSKSFTTQRYLTSHTMGMHSGKEKKRVYDHTCSVCGASYTAKTSLKRHMLSHTGEKQFLCTICDKAFASKTPLQLHLKTHTGQKDFFCGFCGKAFARNDALKQHLLLHTGKELYHCSICQKAYARKSSLTYHIFQNHIREKYSADLVPRGRSKPDVTRKRKTHRRRKRKELQNEEFICKVCRNIFSTKAGLVQHMNIHKRDNDKSFPCDICGKRFWGKFALAYHQKSHSTEKPFSCSHCEKAFKHKRSLVIHMTCHLAFYVSSSKKTNNIKDDAFVELNPLEISSPSSTVKLDPLEISSQSSTVKLDPLEISSQSSTVKLDPLKISSQSSTVKLDPLKISSQSSTVKLDPQEISSQSSTMKLDPLEISSQSSTVKLDPLVISSQSSVRGECSEIKSEDLVFDVTTYLNFRGKSPARKICGESLNDHSYFRGKGGKISAQKTKSSRKRKRKPKLCTCNICDRTLVSEQSYRVHKWHHENGYFFCAICHGLYRTKRRITKHISQNHLHPDVLYCSFCGNSFRLRCRLEYHILICHLGWKPDKQYECTVCQKSFNTKPEICRHKETHSKERLFTCGICRKSYSTKAAMIVHMKTQNHTVDRI